MRERERGGGGRRERKKLYCNGWIHVNEFKKKKKATTTTTTTTKVFKKKKSSLLPVIVIVTTYIIIMITDEHHLRNDIFLMLAHLFGTICLKHSATLVLPPLLKPPSRRTCLITISKLFFTALPVPSSDA